MCANLASERRRYKLLLLLFMEKKRFFFFFIGHTWDEGWRGDLLKYYTDSIKCMKKEFSCLKKIWKEVFCSILVPVKKNLYWCKIIEWKLLFLLKLFWVGVRAGVLKRSYLENKAKKQFKAISFWNIQTNTNL